MVATLGLVFIEDHGRPGQESRKRCGPVAKKKRSAASKKSSKRSETSRRRTVRDRSSASATTSDAGADPPSEPSPPTSAGSGFPIVGIGASAGGLEALEALFAAMPVDADLAFVLVVHLDPTHISVLPELLQRHTTMPVSHVIDAVHVSPNHVYVIPPNKELTILNATLRLTELTQPRSTRLPIDSFLRSLAQDQQQNAICIILSGTGTDGTLGTKAIKGHGGMVMVQDEETAKYDGMPRSAIATGLVDYVLSPAEMPQQLVKYTTYSRRIIWPSADPTAGMDSGTLQKILAVLRTRTNHDFSLYKKNTICRRIDRRMSVHQIDEAKDYLRYLRESDREADVLFKELLIGVTRFFRDPEAFEALREAILPALLSNDPDRHSIRVWVPGCSSGEEAYSAAILLDECMERVERRFQVHIFATDIDENALAVARRGTYPASIRDDLGATRLKRYFSEDDSGQCRIKKRIREMLIFAPQSVIKDPPFTRLDLLCCRNVLIYLGRELQKKLLPLFHYSLRPGGILFLGSSETIGQATDLFTTLDKKWKLFRRKPTTSATRANLEFPTASMAYGERDPEARETVPEAEEVSALRLVETVLKQSNTPPCAVINEDSDVLYIHGRTGRFLEPPEGRSSTNLVAMARPELRAELASAIREAAHGRAAVTHNNLRLSDDDEQLLLNLTVKPIVDQGSARNLMMVTFEEAPLPPKRRGAKRESRTSRQGGRTADQLEHDLQQTRANLQTTIEELETTNEELRSTNEELQSTNEELQSTNEELETSKEELQSLNEESATVNVELQARIDELSKTNDDMKNLLDSTEIATIFLDNDLRVRRFTPKSSEIIPLMATDSDRPIEHFASKLVDVDLAACGERVLHDLVVRQLKVHTVDGRHYLMKVRPYRTVSNVIDGVVITFDDVTEAVRTTEEVRASEARCRQILDSSPVCTIIVDQEGHLEYMNAVSLQQLKVTDASVVYGLPYPPSFFAPATRSALKEHLNRALAGETCSLQCTQQATDGSESTYYTTFVPVNDLRGRVRQVVGTSILDRYSHAE